LPFVKIQDIFIGGYHEFEAIVEGGSFKELLKKGMN
jgi:hypothetical protein